MVLVRQILLHVFALIAISLQTPFIFDDSINFCQYFLNGQPDKYFETTSKTQLVKTYQPLGIKIFFKLCGVFDVNDDCPKGTVACLKTEKKYHFGTSFILEEDYLRSTNGSFCSVNKTYTLVVHMRSGNEKPSFLDIQDKCTYHIEMMHPEHSNRCGTKVYGRFLDLSALARTYDVPVNDKNFSVTLCGADASCGQEDINACEITKDNKSPISTSSSEYMAYDGEKNQINIRGSIRGYNNKIVKRLEVNVKCDWDKNEVRNNDLKYVYKQIQGRKYTFTLETSYGCIKKPASCIVHDKFFIYNLTKLHTEKSLWSVSGEPFRKNSKYFLQVCGPIELVRNNSCKGTYAQVCENQNGIDVNRGSVFSHLEVVSDGVLRGTIDGGTRCKEKPELFSKTMIDFICDKNEGKTGPKFESYGNCDTYFKWRTPEACPRYDPARCSYLVTREPHSCVFDDDINYYNLSAIAKTKVIQDQKMPNLQYKLNICGPVLDPEAPCMKDVSVIMKNSSEPNPKYSIVSLGKFQGSSVINGSLSLQYTTGSYCDGVDYRSEIKFDCSDKEEIFLAKQEKCNFQFVWKTIHGCPKPVAMDKFRDTKNCSFVDNRTNDSVNFGLVPPLQIHTTNYKATIFICGGSYSNCTLNENNCTNTWFEDKKAAVSESNSVVELHLKKICSPPDDFNKVTVNFVCDEFGDNGHFANLKTLDCHIEVDYVTNAACMSEKTSNSTDHSEAPVLPGKEETLIEYVQAEHHQVEHVIDCSIKSPFTNRILNISNLKNSFFKKSCPYPTFNDTFRFVRLLYNSTDVCQPVPTRNVSYEVYLFCAHDVSLSLKSSLGDEECRQYYNYEQKEYCNFFTPKRNSHLGTLIGILVACFLIFGGLMCLLLAARKKRICCFGRLSEGFSSIYERDTQL